MKIDEFRKNCKKIHLWWGEEEVTRLARFSEIMKKTTVDSVKYLLISKDSIGFTDSYRAVVMKATKIVDEAKKPLGFYSPDLLSLLKVAQEIALIDDYTLVIRVKEEIHLFTPTVNQVPDISQVCKIVPSDVERVAFRTDIFSEKEIPLADTLSWKAICTSFQSNDLDFMFPRFYFTHDGIVAKGEFGKTHLEMLFPITLEKECHKALNPKFIDLWIRATTKEKVMGSLIYNTKTSGSICFEIPNLKYIILPIAWREGEKEWKTKIMQ